MLWIIGVLITTFGVCVLIGNNDRTFVEVNGDKLAETIDKAQAIVDMFNN
jgi:hypothetical protein